MLSTQDFSGSELLASVLNKKTGLIRQNAPKVLCAQRGYVKVT